MEFVDWDGDGRLDALFNGENADWYRKVGDRQGKTVLLKNIGPLDDRKRSGHTSSPKTVDWDGNGVSDPLVGSEDDRLYYKLNLRTDLWGDAKCSIHTASLIDSVSSAMDSLVENCWS